MHYNLTTTLYSTVLDTEQDHINQILRMYLLKYIFNYKNKYNHKKKFNG